MNRLGWISLGLLAVIALCAAAAPVLPLHDPSAIDIANRFAGPSLAHPFGQDQFGRDTLARLVWGARASIMVAVTSSVVAAVIGTMIGLVAGFIRGLPEALSMRSIDVLLCFPPFLLAMLVVTFTGPGTLALIPVLILVFVPGFARIAYASTLSVRNREYVEAAQALGATRPRIMARTLLPGILPPIIVQLSIVLASAVVLESGLSFLGMGVVPPDSSWGQMVGEARATLAVAPMQVVAPSLALIVTILLLNVVCDLVRDRLDPSRSTLPARRPAARHPAADAPPEAVPGAAPGAAKEALLDVRGLTVSAGTPAGDVPLVKDITFRIDKNEVLAFVGESGSGKSLTSLAIMGLLPPALRVTAGSARLEGRDVTRLGERELVPLRGSRMAIIFQDPAASMNPVHRIAAHVREALGARGGGDVAAAILDLLAKVGIPDPRRRAAAYPHQLSGGMKQRVMIAMAIARKPGLIIADEPTTALDVTVQAQILKLLKDVQAEAGAGMLFVSHSLPVVSQIADRIAVMYGGQIVEQGSARAILEQPKHPYSRALIEAIPGRGTELKSIPGIAAVAGARVEGCAFAPRCEHAADRCRIEQPVIEPAGPGHTVRCLRWSEL